MKSPRSSELAAALQGLRATVRQSVALAPLTHVRIGGPAEWFVDPYTEEDLVGLLRVCLDLDVPVYVLGGGSNLIVADSGVEGIVLSTGSLNRIVGDGVRITAGAGVSLPSLLRSTKDQGLAGLETLSGIPAVVGGAVAMNAGTRDGQTFDRLVSLTVVDPAGEVRVLNRKECQPSYRNGGLGDQIVLKATFELWEESPNVIYERFARSLKRRSATQPVAEKSIGCVFRNPDPQSAGQLIEAAGCKMMRRGAVSVSGVHANFFINEGRGTSADFLALVNDVRDRVRDHSEVELQMEVKMWGF